MIVSRAKDMKARQGGARDIADRGVLVVGGAGFIGGNLVRKLLELGAREIFVVDNLLSSDVRNVPDDPSVEFILGSVANDRVLERLPRDVDFVFHLAGSSCAQAAVLDPLSEHENTALATLKLFDRLKHFYDLEKIVYVASDPERAARPKREPRKNGTRLRRGVDSGLMPTNISKVVSELYASFYNRQHGVPTIGIRLGTVYGPGEILGAGQWRGTQSTVWRALIPSLIYRMLAGEDLASQNHADDPVAYQYVDDIVTQMLGLAVGDREDTIIEASGGVNASAAELVSVLQRLMTQHNGAEAGRNGATCPAKHDAAFALADHDAIGPLLEDGLAHTVAWMAENISMIRGCMQQHARFVDIPEIDRAGFPGGDHDALMAATRVLPAYQN